MDQRPTMAQLARLCDVDVSTVSRALNDSPLVRPETKTQIVKVAAELGYFVNASARNLRKRSAEAIGMVVPMRPGSGQTMSDPFFLEMVGAVSQAASARGYDLIVSVPSDDGQIADRRLLQTGRADGLIIIGQAGRSERLNSLGPLSSRVVVWGGQIEGSTYTVVGSDNREGGRQVCAHLLAEGRRKILFVGDVSLPEAALRYHGLLDAHAQADLAHDQALILKEDFGARNVQQGIHALLAQGPAFDAVFAASDQLALGVIQALLAAGLRVPADIAVAGYDNITLSGLSTPTLTTFDQSILQGGELLVDRLVRKINGEQVSSRTTDGRLIVRQSTLHASP